MLIVSIIFFFGGRYAFSDPTGKMEISVLNGTDLSLSEFLNKHYAITKVPVDDKDKFIADLENTNSILLEENSGKFMLYAYKKTPAINTIKSHLTEFNKIKEMQKIGLTADVLTTVLSPAPVIESFVYTNNSRKRLVLSYFFAGLMIMAVFLSFAYQFTAITGEKQLKITEQIVSAISPQVWMDGKIFGITLTGLSSMLTYTILSILGGILFFQFKGWPTSDIYDYIYLPSILIYLPFALVGVLLWNAVMAGIASIITDPNNSGKSALMMLPILFLILSFLVIRDPDSNFSIFLSWFPLTSATSMPVRWALSEVGYLQLAGSFLLLVLTFYFLRRLAAKIFRVSILITGKEPTFREVYKLSKQA